MGQGTGTKQKISGQGYNLANFHSIQISNKSVNCEIIQCIDNNPSSGSTAVNPQKFNSLTKKSKPQNFPYTNSNGKYKSISPLKLNFKITFYFGITKEHEAEIIF